MFVFLMDIKFKFSSIFEFIYIYIYMYFNKYYWLLNKKNQLKPVWLDKYY